MSDEAGQTTEQLRPWIARYQSGDEEAWNEAVEHALNRLRRMASAKLRRSSLRGKQETDDLVNEAWLGFKRAFESGPGGRPQDVRGFFTLASKKIREALIDLYRREQRYPATPIAGDRQDDQTSLSKRASRAEEKLRIHQLVDRLSPDIREAWELCHYQGLSYGEAANLLGVSSKTIQRRIIEAKHSLFEWLSQSGINPEA